MRYVILFNCIFMIRILYRNFESHFFNGSDSEPMACYGGFFNHKLTIVYKELVLINRLSKNKQREYLQDKTSNVKNIIFLDPF